METFVAVVAILVVGLAVARPVCAGINRFDDALNRAYEAWRGPLPPPRPRGSRSRGVLVGAFFLFAPRAADAYVGVATEVQAVKWILFAAVCHDLAVVAKNWWRTRKKRE